MYDCEWVHVCFFIYWCVKKWKTLLGKTVNVASDEVRASLLPSGHLHKNSTDVWELGQEISSTENGGKCLEASRFCCVDCMFLIVLPSILLMSSMLQMCASWGRRSTVMGTVSHALEGCTERAVTCLSSLPPWLDHAHSGGHVSAGLQCWSVNHFFELKNTFKRFTV